MKSTPRRFFRQRNWLRLVVYVLKLFANLVD